MNDITHGAKFYDQNSQGLPPAGAYWLSTSLTDYLFCGQFYFDTSHYEWCGTIGRAKITPGVTLFWYQIPETLGAQG
jgi:hypothetical protein